MKTKVIFRKFKEGDVIALFPEEMWTPTVLETCASYMHVGQHGGADVGIVGWTTLASPGEYYDLRAELESIGYDLEVVYKFTRKHLEARMQQVNR